jgi:protein arginine kinase
VVDDEVLFMGLSGDLHDLIGDLIVVQNNYSIGMSEEQILHAIQTAGSKLASAEKTMRKHLKDEQPSDFKDLVSKAFGLIVHAFQLETKETLDLLSVMKFGLSLGLISGVSDDTLNELFFKCRRGHLTHLFPELKENEAINHKRAEYLQKEVAGISLA